MDGVKLLGYKYFVGALDVGGKTNTYSGSLSINPEHHSAFDNEFKYRVSLKEEGDGERKIVAECYVGNLSFENTPIESIATLEFEGSDKGVDDAREWLNQAYQKVTEAAD